MNEDKLSTSAMSSLNETCIGIGNDADASEILKSLKVNNVNRLVIGHLNINSIRHKFDSLKHIIGGNVDILVITETKIDDSFPPQQFFIEGYAPPYRQDNKTDAGGVLVYIRDDIPCRQLKSHSTDRSLEGIFLEINLRKTK